MNLNALETQENIARLLVVPSSRRPATPHEVAAFNARLAPIEMHSPSLHLMQGFQKSLPVSKPDPDHPPISTIATPRKSLSLEIPGWFLPCIYAGVGTVLALCTLLVPHLLGPCAHILGPLWTAGVAVHALADGDSAWVWLGFLTALLLPFVLLVGHPLFACFYLLVFSAFVSGRFWRSLQGPAFILVCVCLFGLVTACALSLLAEHPHAQLSVGTGFSLGAAIVSSAARFGRLRLSVAGI
jgi:hypothetical protein